MKAAVFGIAGWKNSGKTTLTERLIAELTRRGYTVSTVKHAHHGFDIDQPETDSFRHRQAGSRETAIVSSRRWALMHELVGEEEPALEHILEKLAPCDIVLVEGFKRSGHPKIEARRLQARDIGPLGPDVPNIVAVATDHPVEGVTVPVFDLEDAAAVCDFVLALFGLPAAR